MRKVFVCVAVSLISWNFAQAQEDMWFEEMQDSQELFINEPADEDPASANILSMELPPKVLFALDQGDYQHLTITRARLLDQRDQRRLQITYDEDPSVMLYELLLEDENSAVTLYYTEEGELLNAVQSV
uniref:DUF3244 domain-containing protein n=1 Tax=Roseihalotalea indica TaxID=2867963 RepID=A0AA49GTS2_9BACT|nr:hypothetical protein K4G66_02695 [Tunicatimonas sp. TK19036]